VTDAQYAWVVSVLGPDAMTRAEADAAYLSLGSVTKVVAQYAGAQMAVLRSSAMSVSIAGAISVQQSENYKAWERMLTWLQGLPGDPTDETTTDSDPAHGILAVAQLVPNWRRTPGPIVVREPF
jgi:hypothetical protein